jgi:hypothetical protein
MTYAELIEVVRACEDIRLNGCTPSYLQEFIAQRLDGAHSAIAGRVRSFNGDQMHRLCLYIKETHELTR